MVNLNKGHRTGSLIRRFLARHLALVSILLVTPRVLAAQQTSAEPARGNGPVPEPTVVARMFTAPQPSSSPRSESLTPRPAGIAPALVLVSIPSPNKREAAHPFWDRENRFLFAANGAMATADFFVTRRNLSHAGVELNPITRMFTSSTPALAANFALETGGVVGVSYLFHKTGHHKLERITSSLNLSASAFAVGYGLAHR